MAKKESPTILKNGRANHINYHLQMQNNLHTLTNPIGFWTAATHSCPAQSHKHPPKNNHCPKKNHVPLLQYQCPEHNCRPPEHSSVSPKYPPSKTSPYLRVLYIDVSYTISYNVTLLPLSFHYGYKRPSQASTRAYH